MKELCLFGGVVKNISDGTQVHPGKRGNFYKENKASFVFWDAVPEAKYPASRSNQPFDEKKLNNNRDGYWIKELSDVGYGL